MTTEQVNESVSPSYDNLIEEEEETITLDFDNQKIYQKEEHFITSISSKPFVVDPKAGIISHDPKTGVTISDCVYRRPTIDTNTVIPEPVKEAPIFQTELNNLLVDTMTSKALASLLSKHRSVSDEVEELIHSKRMGELTDLLDSEIHNAMEKRRQEIRSCFIGGTVRYEKIPSWARSYVKEYIKDMVHGLVMLTDDGE